MYMQILVKDVCVCVCVCEFYNIIQYSLPVIKPSSSHTEYLAAPAVCPLDSVLLSFLLTGLLNQSSPGLMEKDTARTLTGYWLLVTDLMACKFSFFA